MDVRSTFPGKPDLQNRRLEKCYFSLRHLSIRIIFVNGTPTRQGEFFYDNMSSTGCWKPCHDLEQIQIVALSWDEVIICEECHGYRISDCEGEGDLAMQQETAGEDTGLGVGAELSSHPVWIPQQGTTNTQLEETDSTLDPTNPYLYPAPTQTSQHVQTIDPSFHLQQQTMSEQSQWDHAMPNTEVALVPLDRPQLTLEHENPMAAYNRAKMNAQLQAESSGPNTQTSLIGLDQFFHKEPPRVMRPPLNKPLFISHQPAQDVRSPYTYLPSGVEQETSLGSAKTVPNQPGYGVVARLPDPTAKVKRERNKHELDYGAYFDVVNDGGLPCPIRSHVHRPDVCKWWYKGEHGLNTHLFNRHSNIRCPEDFCQGKLPWTNVYEFKDLEAMQAHLEHHDTYINCPVHDCKSRLRTPRECEQHYTSAHSFNCQLPSCRSQLRDFNGRYASYAGWSEQQRLVDHHENSHSPRCFEGIKTLTCRFIGCRRAGSCFQTKQELDDHSTMHIECTKPGCAPHNWRRGFSTWEEHKAHMDAHDGKFRINPEDARKLMKDFRCPWCPTSDKQETWTAYISHLRTRHFKRPCAGCLNIFDRPEAIHLTRGFEWLCTPCQASKGPMDQHRQSQVPDTEDVASKHAVGQGGPSERSKKTAEVHNRERERPPERSGAAAKKPVHRRRSRSPDRPGDPARKPDRRRTPSRSNPRRPDQAGPAPILDQQAWDHSQVEPTEPTGEQIWDRSQAGPSQFAEQQNWRNQVDPFQSTEMQRWHNNEFGSSRIADAQPYYIQASANQMPQGYMMYPVPPQIPGQPLMYYDQQRPSQAASQYMMYQSHPSLPPTTGQHTRYNESPNQPRGPNENDWTN